MKVKNNVSVMLLVCIVTLVFSRDNVPASYDPPGGLSPEECPLFIVLGWDDNLYPDGMKWALDYMKDKKNPAGNGNPATFDEQSIKSSFYMVTRALEQNNGDELLALWREAKDQGHEIAAHTHTHPDMAKELNYDQCREEIKKNRTILADKLAIDMSQINGFRTPFLSYNQNSFKAIADEGLLYECTITHQSDFHKKQFVWPYTLDSGFHPITQVGNGTSYKFPGLWEIPVYTLSTDISGFPPYTGFDSTILLQSVGKQFLQMLKLGIDFRLQPGANRAPLTVGLHTDTFSPTNPDAAKWYDKTMSCDERRKVMEEFIDYALTKPEVRFVTAQQLIAWMKNPVALNSVSVKNNDTIKKQGVVVTSYNKKIQIRAKSQGTYSVRFFDLTGKTLMKKEVSFRENGETVVLSKEHFTGVVFCSVKNNTGYLSTHRLLK